MSTPLLREALRKRYAFPEWVLMEEVRDAAGFSGKRSADGIAMGMWPSRGLEIHGIEVKAYRGDWLRELKDPAKADVISSYCDRWWIVAAPNVVNIDELPVAWGLLELRGQSLKALKEAPRNENVRPLNRHFVAAMMRRVGQIDAEMVRRAVDAETARMRKQADEHVKYEVERRTKRLAEVEKHCAGIKQACGIDLMSYYVDTEKAGAAIRYALEAHDVTQGYTGLVTIAKQMSRLVEQIDALGPLLPAKADDKKEAA